MGILYQSQSVVVSESRVTIFQTDYPVRNIAAVGIRRKRTATNIALALIAFGTILLVFFLIGVIPLAYGIWLWFKPTFIIIFQTNAGPVDAYITSDEQEAQSIRFAINQAIDQL